MDQKCRDSCWPSSASANVCAARTNHLTSHAPPYVILQLSNPQLQPQAHVRCLRSINVCRNRLIEPQLREQSFGQRCKPSWRRGELAPAACFMVGEAAIIHSQHLCAQDVRHEPLLAGQAQLLLIQGLLDASHPRSAVFPRKTMANDPSSLSDSAKHCATAKSHGIKSPWDWA